MIADLDPYPEYRESGVPWVGTFPVHWSIQRGKSVFSEMRLPVRDIDEIVTCFRDGEVTLRRNRRTTGFMIALKEVGYQGVRRGQLVIHSMDAFAGAVGISDSDGKCSPEYIVCSPRRHETVPAYFGGALRLAAHSNFIQVSCPAVRERAPRLRFPNFGRMVLPVPSASEQSAIARFLDYADRCIRRYIRAKQKLIKLLEEQKQAIIYRAVTRGLDPDARLKPSGVEWLGEVPEHWEVVPLRRVTTSRCDGPFGSGLKSSHYTDHGIRVVRLQNIGHAEFKDSDTAFISPAHNATLGDHSVDAGDLLIAGLGDERHPAGRACVAPSSIVPAMVKADCFRFRIDKARLDAEFAAFHLTATALGASAVLSSGATRQRTNLQSTASRRICFPLLKQQVAINGHISSASEPLRAAADHAQREIILLREYRTRLIADVVTGKLDVREAASRLPEDAEEALPYDNADALAKRDEDADDAGASA